MDLDAFRAALQGRKNALTGQIVQKVGPRKCLVKLDKAYQGVDFLVCQLATVAHPGSNVVVLRLGSGEDTQATVKISQNEVVETLGGNWAAFADAEQTASSIRKEVERGNARRKSVSVGGKVGYLCLTQVGKRTATNQTDPEGWAWVWQLWVGGFTENMILVKEWAVPNDGLNQPRYWQRETVSSKLPFAILDMRAEEFFVSLQWRLQEPGGIRLYWGLLKGALTNLTIAENGTPSIPITTSWQRRDIDFPDPKPSTLGLTCAGFGFWTNTADFSLANDPRVAASNSHALFDNQVQIYPSTVNVNSYVPFDNGGLIYEGIIFGFDRVEDYNKFTPVGKTATPLESTYKVTSGFYAYQKAVAFPAPDVRSQEEGNNNSYSTIDAIVYSLLRVDANAAGDNALVLCRERQYNSSDSSAGQGTYYVQAPSQISSSSQTIITDSVSSRLNSAKIYGYSSDYSSFTTAVNGESSTTTNGPTVTTSYTSPAGVNLPNITRDVIDKGEPETNAPLLATIAISPLSITIAGHRGNIGFTAPLPGGSTLRSDNYAIASAANPTGVTTAIFRRYWDDSQWYYEPLYDWSLDNQYSRYFCDVYPNFVSVLSQAQIAGRDPVKITPIWKIFPELTPSNAPTEPINPIPNPAQNIEHQNRECLVQFLTADVDGAYTPKDLTVTVLRAKQVQAITENPLQSLQFYRFCNASFALDE